VPRPREIAKHSVTIISLIAIAGAVYYAYEFEHTPPSRSSDSTLAKSAPEANTAPLAVPAPASHPAPVNVFAKAVVGDWSAFRIEHKSSLLEAGSTVLWTVTSADAVTVVVGGKGRLDTGEEKDLRDMTFPRSDLTLERLLEMDYSEWKILRAETGQEPHQVGGRSFDCTTVTFSSSDPLFPDKQTETQIWFSAEVTGSGIVESREVQLLGDMRFEITKTLVGFGSKEKTTWGERPFAATP